MKITESKNLYIKNMVCPRCIATVKYIFKDLGIPIERIQLGEVIPPHSLDESQKLMLSEKLTDHGFELLTDSKSKLIGQIKSLLIKWIHYPEETSNKNFSLLLSENLNHDYSYLSKLFSPVEGITIERFIVRQKIEKVKELIIYDELTLSEIAFQMGYSSVAYLSTQFKNETGMTPTEFKKLKKPDRRSLDSL
ncbi:MAG: AraC family transcriptional regulator [Cyclobacteriaceae bacterium]